MINRSTDAYGRTNAILPHSDRAASFTRLLGGAFWRLVALAWNLDDGLPLGVPPADVPQRLRDLDQVLLGVVDYGVGAERAHDRDVARAADRRHVGAKGLRDLDRPRAHSAGRAVDQDPLAHLQPSGVAEPLQRGDRPGHRCGLLE